MDELNMEPMPENPKFNEDLHYIEVVLDSEWQAAVPRVVCNDPDHKTQNGKTDCRMADLIKDEGWDAIGTPAAQPPPVIAKFQFGYEREWLEGRSDVGVLGEWEMSAIFRNNIPWIEEES